SITSSFLLPCSLLLLYLHSFPTRRSSDLSGALIIATMLIRRQDDFKIRTVLDFPRVTVRCIVQPGIITRAGNFCDITQPCDVQQVIIPGCQCLDECEFFLTDACVALRFKEFVFFSASICCFCSAT